MLNNFMYLLIQLILLWNYYFSIGCVYDLKTATFNCPQQTQLKGKSTK